jgi:hypothetical protein
MEEKFEVVEIEIDDKTLHELMLQAHYHDVTLNQYCDMILKKYIEENAMIGVKENGVST